MNALTYVSLKGHSLGLYILSQIMILALALGRGIPDFFRLVMALVVGTGLVGYSSGVGVFWL